jgi:phage tail-like protein
VNDPAPATTVSDGHDLPAAGEALSRAGAESVPEVASAREYLRSGLPSIYREEDSFGMRFMCALERVLDRQVAIVDSLGAYLSPQLAPPQMVDAIAGWLGLALDDVPTEEVCRELLGSAQRHTLTEDARRKLLGSAEQIARLRGTRAGLELVFEICLPGLHLWVKDHGEVVLLEGAVAPPNKPYPGYEVHCPTRLEPALRNAVECAIERQRPMQVTYKLVEDASELVKDASELVKDASELVEDASPGPVC